MLNPPRVYVAGPYGALTEWEIHLNIQRAMLVAQKLWAKGYAVLCPHANSAYMGGEVKREMFIRGDLRWVEVSEMLVLIDGWERSEGAKEERAFAECHGIPVVYPHQIDSLPDLTREAAPCTAITPDLSYLDTLQHKQMVEAFRANRQKRDMEIAKAMNDAMNEATAMISDFHAGDHLPPSNLYSDEARKMLDQEARAEMALLDRVFKAYSDDLLDSLIIYGGPLSPYSKRNPLFGVGDLLPTKQEEASSMNLYSVILIDPRDGAICINTQIVAKTPEQAKLKAGVYRWLEEAEMELDDVTVAVRPEVYHVKLVEKVG